MIQKLRGSALLPRLHAARPRRRTHAAVSAQDGVPRGACSSREDSRACGHGCRVRRAIGVERQVTARPRRGDSAPPPSIVPVHRTSPSQGSPDFRWSSHRPRRDSRCVKDHSTWLCLEVHGWEVGAGPAVSQLAEPAPSIMIQGTSSVKATVGSEARAWPAGGACCSFLVETAGGAARRRVEQVAGQRPALPAMPLPTGPKLRALLGRLADQNGAEPVGAPGLVTEAADHEGAVERMGKLRPAWLRRPGRYAEKSRLSRFPQVPVARPGRGTCPRRRTSAAPARDPCARAACSGRAPPAGRAARQVAAHTGPGHRAGGGRRRSG